MPDELVLSPSLNDRAISLIPESHQYSQNYRVSRVKLDPIDITEESARAIFKQVIKGDHAVIIGKHLVMCSSIMSIDPLPLKIRPRAGHFEGDAWVEEK